MAVTAGVVAAGAAVASLGYGIYSSQEAAATQAKQYAQARQDAQAQQQQQQAMLQQQQQQQAALASQQTAQQQETYAQQQQAQKDALAAAQAQIPVIQGQLSQSLSDSQKQAMTSQEPLIEGRLNALGLLQSGALPAQQAKYQADLASQAQQELANYGTSANQAIQNQALAYTGTNTADLQSNLQQTLQNQQAALNQQFAGQDTAYQNQVAQSQYLANLQAAQTAAAQAQANQFINLGGQLGGGALSYFGKSQAPQVSSPAPQGYGLTQSYTSPSSPSYSGGVAFDPFSATGITQSPGSYFTAPSQVGQVGSYDAYGNFTGPASSPIAPYTPWTPYTGGT